MHSYQEPKSPLESHPSARRREPQAGARRAIGPPPFVLGGQYPMIAYYVNTADRTCKVCSQAYSAAKRTLILAQDAIKRRFN